MHWIVDNSLNHSFLNTAAWKYIYPQLYLQYPYHDMSLNISATSSPAVKIAKNGINVTIYLDVTVNVLDDSKVIPVACISLVCLIEISISYTVIFIATDLLVFTCFFLLHPLGTSAK